MLVFSFLPTVMAISTEAIIGIVAVIISLPPSLIVIWKIVSHRNRDRAETNIGMVIV
jgi:hypothetical protein